MKGPTGDGLIDEADGAFDLITCFGVLTYMPDPLSTFGELRRCLAPGGWLLVREPIVAMNLEQPESSGLGRYGRGIPLAVFGELVRQGLTLHYRGLCVMAVTRYLVPAFLGDAAAVRADAALARLAGRSSHYRATRRLRPKAVAYVLHRQETAGVCS